MLAVTFDLQIVSNDMSSRSLVNSKHVHGLLQVAVFLYTEGSYLIILKGVLYRGCREVLCREENG